MLTADDAVDRLELKRLKEVHEAIAKLMSQRQEVQREDEWQDFRANLHVHSAFSHDSRGSIDEIVIAARKVGTQVLMFNEHPAEHYDYVVDGHQGLRDGVLLIPGAETKGMLVFPTSSLRGLDGGDTQAFAELVAGRGGLAFLSHLEERMELEVPGLCGVEIYNTHADFKDESRMAAKFRDPLWLVSLADRARKYPQEVYSALQDYPTDYLTRWDQLCEGFPHTGVSANDAHQNIGIRIRLNQQGGAVIEDALGEKITEVSMPVLLPLLSGLSHQDQVEGVEPAEQSRERLLFSMQLDPYEQSLKHVATHLLMKELTRESVWDSLRAGRAFVAFDWLADSNGVQVHVKDGDNLYPLGSQLAWQKQLQIVGSSPLPAMWRVYCDGMIVAEENGRQFNLELERPGRYRVELWLEIAGENQIWVLNNPFYVSAK